jgi:hypothetical protein
MRVKPIGKIVILLVIGVIAFFAIKRFLPAGKSDDSVVNTTTVTDSSGTAARKESPMAGEGSSASPASVPAGSAANNSRATPEHRSFDYTPEKPVNGILRGVVEVGASGFNSFVINMDKEKRWEIVSKDFGESLAYEGLISTDDIRAGLKKYLVGMFQKGVNKNNMHFVISSGAQKVPKTTIIANELKKIGYVVNTVTADQEAKFALRATVPQSFAESSFLTDIGSGNTKVSWNEGGSLKAIETAGAKYYEQGRADDAVYSEVKDKVVRVPESKRNVCFILGGVPFTLAKPIRKGDERYTVLNPPNSYKAADKKMAAGLNIYKAIADATKTDTFVFDWDANFTIGFLLTLP